MAFIYRYQLRRKSEREEIDLTQHAETLKTVLKTKFEDNVKEIIVEKRFFQFKLFTSVSTSELNLMGKRIKNGSISSEFGFVRQNIELYALVTEVDKEQKNITIDFIDSEIANSEVFLARVNDFSNENGLSEYLDEVKRNYYVDVYSGEIVLQDFPIIGTKEVKEGDCFKIQVLHKHEEMQEYSRDSGDKKPKVFLQPLLDYQYLSKQHTDVVNVYQDQFVLEKISEMSAQSFKDVIEVLDYTELKRRSMLDTTLDDFFKGIQKGRIIDFCVHNVGQALATSFAYEDETPFLYFDYGLPNHFNRDTLPEGVNLPINEQTKIVLSHLDTDHWLGVRKFHDAYGCTWYVPDQMRPIFNKEIANIQMAGGKVVFLIKSIVGVNFSLSYLEKSTQKPTRLAKKVHETGAALCILATDTAGMAYKILVEGDQDYDYLCQNFLTDVNCLVACHHGGIYSWTKKAALPTPNSSNNTIIYSYGDGNTHKHPNADVVLEYQNMGWNNAHHSPLNGDYIKKIVL